MFILHPMNLFEKTGNGKFGIIIRIKKKALQQRLKYDYIVIEGNIGTGKTSLATKIADEFNTKIVLERFADNPFPDFCKYYLERCRVSVVPKALSNHQSSPSKTGFIGVFA